MSEKKFTHRNDDPGQRRLNILVADDNAINLHLINTFLVRMGHEVDAVRDGAAAVEKFSGHVYDVILMDVMMPVMDGITASVEIRKIEAERKTEADRRVRIIAVTANAFEDDREAYSRAGMDHYISKPLKFDDLQNLLISIFDKG
jgi:CheY-like chemotaxis protein